MEGYPVSELSFALSTVTALFVSVDPFGCVPLFVAMTEGDESEHRRRAALRASLVAGATLTVFAVSGTFIFRPFGVSVAAFRIAGGALLFLLAVDMLRAQRSRQRTTPEEEAEGANKQDVSTFPLGIPMLAGPGAISTVMVLVSHAKSAYEHAVVLGAIAATLLVTYWVLRGASVVAYRLGRTGMNVLQRVMGLILAAVAVQFLIDGLAVAFPRLM
ncbi:MAG: MarC family protein [Polyangiaceae bacterium]